MDLAISKLALAQGRARRPERACIEPELLKAVREHITRVSEAAGQSHPLRYRAGMDTMSVIHEGSLTTTAEMRPTTLPPRVFNLVIGDPLTEGDLQFLRREFNATVVELVDHPKTHRACKNTQCKGLAREFSDYCSTDCVTASQP